MFCREMIAKSNFSVFITAVLIVITDIEIAIITISQFIIPYQFSVSNSS